MNTTLRQRVIDLYRSHEGPINSKIAGKILGENPESLRKTISDLKRMSRLPEHEYAKPEPKKNDIKEDEKEKQERDRSSFLSGLQEENLRLREEVEKLRGQSKWLAHNDAVDYTGGTVTFAISDLHLHDRSHMVRTLVSMQRKVCEAATRFSPRIIRILVLGDIIPGRGVFKRQMIESVLPKAADQIKAGTWRMVEFHRAIEIASPKSEIHWNVVRGTHDVSEGEDTAEQFCSAMRGFGISILYHGEFEIFNLADTGTHNVITTHGHGSAKKVPTPPSLRDNLRDKIIALTHQGWCGENRIYRAIHGHTHWFCPGIDSEWEVPIDVLGGIQRNDRSDLGQNNRPVGWIAYVSPKGTNTISLIPLMPSEQPVLEDRKDEHLHIRNQAEAARCFLAFEEHAEGALKRRISSPPE